MTSSRTGTPTLALLMTLLIGCGGPSEPLASPGSGGKAPAARSATAEEAGDDTVAGKVSLTINGTPTVFAYLPAEKTMAMSMSSMVQAKPDAEATEAFMIMVMNFNLKKAELPATLEPGLRDAMEQDDRSGFAFAPKPLIEYTSPAGVEYASYGTVTFQSYEDGITRGHIEDLEIGPADKENAGAGAVLLTDISFEVAL